MDEPGRVAEPSCGSPACATGLTSAASNASAPPERQAVRDNLNATGLADGNIDVQVSEPDVACRLRASGALHSRQTWATACLSGRALDASTPDVHKWGGGHQVGQGGPGSTRSQAATATRPAAQVAVPVQRSRRSATGKPAHASAPRLCRQGLAACLRATHEG
eukprot:s3444_g11.t1